MFNILNKEIYELIVKKENVTDNEIKKKKMQ